MRCQSGGAISGRVSIPDQKSANLIHPRAGLASVSRGDAALDRAVAVLGMADHPAWRLSDRRPGEARRAAFRSGASCASMASSGSSTGDATCFIILAISGLNITFGKPLLMPLIGEGAFAAWAQWAKVRAQLSQLPVHDRRVLHLPDVGAATSRTRSMSNGSSAVAASSARPSAGPYRFNAGQKLIYWIVVLGGTAVAISGYLLMSRSIATDIPGHAALPDRARDHRGTVRRRDARAHLHGTIGMEGAFEAMGEGTVDVNWAKEHHRSGWSRDGPHRPDESTSASPMATPAE